MRHKFHNKQYNINFVPPSQIKKLDGDCDAPHICGKTIRIAKGLPEERQLTVLIHESLHACNWTLDEEWVTKSAEDISALLRRLGWRRDHK